MFFFYSPLKTSANLSFSDVLRGYRKGTLAWNGFSSMFTKHLKMAAMSPVIVDEKV